MKNGKQDLQEVTQILFLKKTIYRYLLTMNSTYTITEGNEALNRALLMMRYDLTKTLSEQKKFTDQDIKKLKNDEFENNTRKYVDKTAVSFRGPEGKKISTATFPKMTKKIEATTMSEGILKMRDFFYSPEGATTQVVLSIVGVEIGAPIVFAILDSAIIVNDAYIMVRDWDPNGPKMDKGLWEWFNFHFTNNIGFQYLCVDVLALLAGFGIMGLGKIAVKSSKAVFRALVKQFGKEFPKKIAIYLRSLSIKSTKQLPKPIGNWVERKMSDVNKAIDLLKTPEKAIKSVVKPKRVVTAGVAGKIVYDLMIWIESHSEDISNFFKSNPNSDYIQDLNVTEPEDKELMNAIIVNNPNIFTKNFKLKNFKIVFSKKDKDDKPDYFIINDVKYKMDDSMDNLTLTKTN